MDPMISIGWGVWKMHTPVGSCVVHTRAHGRDDDASTHTHTHTRTRSGLLGAAWPAALPVPVRCTRAAVAPSGASSVRLRLAVVVCRGTGCCWSSPPTRLRDAVAPPAFTPRAAAAAAAATAGTACQGECVVRARARVARRRDAAAGAHAVGRHCGGAGGRYRHRRGA